MPFAIRNIIPKAICIIILMAFLTKFTTAQERSRDLITTEALVINGDTIPYSVLPGISVFCKLTAKQRRAQESYNRLRNAVYVTYPYARKAGVVLNDINSKLEHINERSKRKNYIKSREAELRKEFTTPLTNLSVYQGKVLMKLINRETGNNCYEIIKEYQGGLTARLYQTVAFFFNTSLKQPYDATNEDQMIEKFVLEVQRVYGYPEISKGSSM